MNDEALVTRLLRGDQESVELVYVWVRHAFQPYRRRLAAELEDLEQDVLHDLIQALREDRFEGRSRLRTYVVTCVHHKCIDRLRALSRRTWVTLEDSDLTSPAPSALDHLAEREKVNLALRILQEMPEACRELWQMLQQGLHYREMSQRLGVSEVTLRSRVLRCRKRALEIRERHLKFGVQRIPHSDD